MSLACKLALVAFGVGLLAIVVPVGLHAHGCDWLNRLLALNFRDHREDRECSVLTLLYLLSYVKLAITLTK